MTHTEPPAGTTIGALRAHDVMTPHVLALDPTATVEQALGLMRQHRVRHLPVLDGGRVVGLVDDRLVALGHLADEGPRSRPATDLMTHYVPQVAPDADLGRVARLVSDSGCDAVVVLDPAGRLLGLVTATDLVEALARAVLR